MREQEIDGANTGITLTLENKKKMDLAYFAWSETFKMVVPRPGEKSRLLAFVYPFDPLVIITLFFNIVETWFPMHFII
jgi:hypothetical protein